MTTVGVFKRYGKPEEKANGCIEWRGSTNNKGYGFVNGKLAHRVAWELKFGEIPKGGDGRSLFVLHKCDNPPCVNTDHLFLGTHLDNMHDKHMKGRDNFRLWKLKPHEMAELRREIVFSQRTWGWQVRLAQKYGITKQRVNQMVMVVDRPLTSAAA